MCSIFFVCSVCWCSLMYSKKAKTSAQSLVSNAQIECKHQISMDNFEWMVSFVDKRMLSLITSRLISTLPAICLHISNRSFSFCCQLTLYLSLRCFSIFFFTFPRCYSCCNRNFYDYSYSTNILFAFCRLTNKTNFQDFAKQSRTKQTLIWSGLFLC